MIGKDSLIFKKFNQFGIDFVLNEIKCEVLRENSVYIDVDT